MKPSHNQKQSSSGSAASWRQRIDEALSALKTPPPETGPLTAGAGANDTLQVRT
jgi:hypothetical protein